MGIKQTTNRILTKIGVSGIKRLMKRKNKRRTVLSDLLDNPENFKMEAFIEEEEIIVKIRRRKS